LADLPIQASGWAFVASQDPALFQRSSPSCCRGDGGEAGLPAHLAEDEKASRARTGSIPIRYAKTRPLADELEKWHDRACLRAECGWTGPPGKPLRTGFA
jgi:hypothetical protein